MFRLCRLRDYIGVLRPRGGIVWAWVWLVERKPSSNQALDPATLAPTASTLSPVKALKCVLEVLIPQDHRDRKASMQAFLDSGGLDSMPVRSQAPSNLGIKQGCLFVLFFKNRRPLKGDNGPAGGPSSTNGTTKTTQTLNPKPGRVPKPSSSLCPFEPCIINPRLCGRR